MQQLKLDFDDNLAAFYKFIEQCKIRIPGVGITHFKLFEFQKRLIEYCENYDYIIGSKFRHGGFDTTLLLYALWKGLYGENDVVIVSPFVRMVCSLYDDMKLIIEHLPEELQSCIGSNLDLSFRFNNGNTISFYRSDERYKCNSGAIIILAEAAYFKKFNLSPLFDAGKIIIISTLATSGSSFEHLLKQAIKGENCYKVYTCHYSEFPLFQNEEYVQELKLNVGQKFWHKEMEQKLTSE